MLAASIPLVAQELSPLPPAIPSPLEPSPVQRSAETPDEIAVAALRIREGTHLEDVPGRFRQNGDSLTFIDAQNREIGGLPNLNLERVARTLRNVEEPESVAWNVSGVITEFGGRNYILISRAVYKSATPPPPPEILGQAEILASPAPRSGAEASD